MCREKTSSLLDRLRLAHGSIEIFATPRRLVVLAKSVASRQTDISEQLRGPPAKVQPLPALSSIQHYLRCDTLLYEVRYDAHMYKPMLPDPVFRLRLCTDASAFPNILSCSPRELSRSLENAKSPPVIQKNLTNARTSTPSMKLMFKCSTCPTPPMCPHKSYQ